jgi:hypothetical protein
MMFLPAMIVLTHSLHAIRIVTAGLIEATGGVMPQETHTPEGDGRSLPSDKDLAVCQ